MRLKRLIENVGANMNDIRDDLLWAALVGISIPAAYALSRIAVYTKTKHGTYFKIDIEIIRVACSQANLRLYLQVAAISAITFFLCTFISRP